MKSENVNCLYKINNGFDFMAETIFRSMNELEEFLESLDQRFKLVSKQVYFIIEEIAREQFLTKTPGQ